jgi:tetratricopeptide (TPR) repeat protein
MDLSVEAMEFARRLNDPSVMMEALFLQGLALFFRGDFAAAREHFEKAVAEYDDRERTRFWAAILGQDSGVAHRSFLSLALWHLGCPDQAMKVSREVCELARDLGRPYDLCAALRARDCLCYLCRLRADAQTAGEEMVDVASEQGFALYRAIGILNKAAGMVLQGRPQEAVGLALMSFDALRGTGVRHELTHAHSILGDAYTQVGRFEDARRTLDEGQSVSEKHDFHFQEAELHRLEGELHLAEANDQAAAEGCFRTAIETARRQQSRAWELRATMSLARLWQRQGRRDEARTALAAVFDTYTEGFTTPDLVDASALLKALA